MKHLQSIKAEIDRVNLEVQNAERDYDLNHAAELKYGTLMTLQKQLKEAEAALEAQVRNITPPVPPCASFMASAVLFQRLRGKLGGCVCSSAPYYAVG